VTGCAVVTLNGNGSSVKIGIIGGTFDPFHNGHLAIAEEAMTKLGLIEVLFVPAGHPWLKAGQLVTAAEHRVEMVRQAIAGWPHYRLITVEVDRAGPSYTVDTIAELRSQYGAGTDLFFILGWDSLSEVPRWHQPSRLIELCYLVAVPRPGQGEPDLNSLEAAVPGISRRVILLDGPRVDISATGIREKVARGKAIADLVPEAVARYVKQRGLYLSATG
jgi:nicotinate-nucleotide adenylyltransferase